MHIFKASFEVEESKKVGPDATKLISSLGMSEIIKDLIFAGKAKQQSHPPLQKDKCFLIIFNSFISAPLSVNCLNISISFLIKVLFLGKHKRDDPPPDIKK